MALTGGTNAEKAWNFLKVKGFNDYACAGIIGNLDCESALNPYNLQDTYENVLGYSDRTYVESVDNGSYSKDRFIEDEAGFGIAQWTYHSRKRRLYEFIKLRGASIGDYESQLEFFYKELTEGFPSVYYDAFTTKDIGDIGESLVHGHECMRVKIGGREDLIHLIKRIPTQFAVGYDISSVELDERKRYIEVKTTISSKPLHFNRIHLVGSEAAQYRALGNAIPPVMFWYVANAVSEQFPKEE